MRWLINTVGILAWLWGTDLFVAAFMVSLEFQEYGAVDEYDAMQAAASLPLMATTFFFGLGCFWVGARLKSAEAQLKMAEAQLKSKA